MSDYRVIARDRRDILGEGPLWSARDGALYWVDIKGKRINRLTLATESVASFETSEIITWLIERETKPGYLAGGERGVSFLFLDPFSIRTTAAPEAHLPANRMNDAKADRYGRVFAGTMHRDCAGQEGSFYRIDPDLSVARLDSGYGVANGPTFNLAQTKLYHTDSNARTIYAFDLATDGKISRKHTFISFPPEWGHPDGMTTDAEDCIWVAHWDGGRISRFRPDGTLDRCIALPASRITSLAFAGEKLDRLFVTSASEGVEDEPLAGALFELNVGVRGLPPGRFNG